MNTTADIIIIGGGIAGISAGAMLAGDARVIVLEGEDQIGYHSTGRSAAIFFGNYGNATVRALNLASEPFLKQPEAVSDTSVLTPRGLLFIANATELSAMQSFLQGAVGIDELSADEAVGLVPILRRELISRVVYEPDVSDIDVDRLLQGYARMIKDNNGAITTGARVGRIKRQNGTWLVSTGKGNICEAPVLVNAAGAWADNIARIAGIKTIGISPVRRSAALVPAPAGHDITSWPLFASAAEKWYAKPEAGRLMVSPADEDPVDPHDVWADDMTIAEGIDRFESAVTIKIERVQHTWAGMRSFSPDRTPVVGFAANSEGFFWLAGQGGYGIQTSPALSQLTARLILAKKPQLNIETVNALSPHRFDL